MGQIESSLPGARLAPFAEWDVLFFPAERICSFLMQRRDGDYVLRRLGDDPNMLELLVKDGDEVERFPVKIGEDGRHTMIKTAHMSTEMAFMSIDELLSHFMVHKIPFEHSDIQLKSSCGTWLRQQLTHGLQVLGSPAWYVNNPRRESVCKQLVMSAPKGSFMLRASAKNHHYTLVVNDGSKPAHFEIEEAPNGAFNFSGHRFRSAIDLIERIRKSGLPGSHGKVYLNQAITFKDIPALNPKRSEMIRRSAHLDQLPPRSAWYAGPMARNVAASGLLHLKPAIAGDYILHQNPTELNTFYLSVNDGGRAAQYKIFFQDNGFVLGGKRFDKLDDLMEMATKLGLNGQGGQLRLKRAVANHVCELVDSALRTAPQQLAPSRTSESIPEAVVHPQQAEPKKKGVLSRLGAKMSTKRKESHVAPSTEIVSPDSASTTTDIQVQVSDRVILEDEATTVMEHMPDLSTMSIDAARTSRIQDLSRTTMKNDVELLDGLDLAVLPLDIDSYLNLPKRTQREEELEPHCRGRRLNRFRDILPNPTTRVKLAPLKEDPTLEYINANFVRGYGGRRAREYVAAQAPLDTGLFNFWRLIFHIKAATIVMVLPKMAKTSVLAIGRMRQENVMYPTAFQAFIDTGHTLRYGPPGGILSVLAKKITPTQHYVKTVLKVQYLDETHETTHFWYTSWPDHGVPTLPNGEMDTQPILDTLKDVRDTRAGLDQSQSPCLVHCSAGIGRTGTFIAIDHALHALELGEPVDLLQIIDDIRQDRMALVQHVVQYKFAYEAIVSYAKTLTGKRKTIANSTDVYAIARLNDMSQYEDHPDWVLLASSNTAKLYTLKRAHLPSGDNDYVAVFAPKEQIDEGEVVTSPRKAQADTDAIEFQPWYRSNFTQAQVDEILSDANAGTFLVRKSSRPGHFALSIQTGQRIAKLLIVPTIVGGKTRYKLGMTGPDEFPSLQELVAFYLREGIPSSQQAGDVIRLRAPNSSDHPDEEEA